MAAKLVVLWQLALFESIKIRVLVHRRMGKSVANPWNAGSFTSRAEPKISHAKKAIREDRNFPTVAGLGGPVVSGSGVRFLMRVYRT